MGHPQIFIRDRENFVCDMGANVKQGCNRAFEGLPLNVRHHDRDVTKIVFKYPGFEQKVVGWNEGSAGFSYAGMKITIECCRFP